VLEYDDLAKGEEIWGSQVEHMLDEWSRGDGSPRPDHHSAEEK